MVLSTIQQLCGIAVGWLLFRCCSEELYSVYFHPHVLLHVFQAIFLTWCQWNCHSHAAPMSMHTSAGIYKDTSPFYKFGPLNTDVIIY